MKDIKDLRIYQIAVQIGEDVWKIVDSWEDKFSKWTVGKQWVDSADSISANMTEGYYRNQKGDLRKFFQYSLSSAKEAEHWLQKSYNRKLVNLGQMSVYYAAAHLADRSLLLRAGGNDPKINPLPAFTGAYPANLRKHHYAKTATVGMVHCGYLRLRRSAPRNERKRWVFGKAN